MNTQDLIRTVVQRTKIPHDEVRLVLDVVREITQEQLAILDSVMLPQMVKITVRQNRTGKWVAHATLMRELTDVVGTDFRPVD